jgi:hypothetical protein
MSKRIKKKGMTYQQTDQQMCKLRDLIRCFYCYVTEIIIVYVGIMNDSQQKIVKIRVVLQANNSVKKMKKK